MDSNGDNNRNDYWQETRKEREKWSAEWAAFLNIPYAGSAGGDYKIAKLVYDTIDPTRQKDCDSY